MASTLKSRLWIFLLNIYYACQPLYTKGEDSIESKDSRFSFTDFAGVSFKREVPEAFELAGFLPGIKVGALRLSEVYAVQEGNPSTCRYVHVPDDYEADERIRRLVPDTLENISETPLQFKYPRDVVRTMAALNVAALPPAAYEEPLFANTRMGDLSFENIVLTTSTETTTKIQPTTTTTTMKISAEDFAEQRKQDMDTFVAERTKLRETIGSRWDKEKFIGKRSEKCAGLKTSDGMCLTDVGVAISVYRDKDNIVIVFHAGFTKADFDNLMHFHRMWILERFEKTSEIEWSNSVRLPKVPSMNERKADKTTERHIKCAFKDQDYMAAPSGKDLEDLASIAEASLKSLKAVGLWPVIQAIVRDVLPAKRPKVTPEKVWLTGAGSGGMYAAISSMWLSQVDKTNYDTYVIAGVGWDCATRLMLGSEISPWDKGPNIYSYSHVADFFATSMDRMTGTVCRFGWHGFNTSAVMPLCEDFIGHSGPEIFWRGKETPTNESVPTSKMRSGQNAFDACHYFTHSPWFAAMYLMSDVFIELDGVSDGGCHDVKPIPQKDEYGVCPVTTPATSDCELLLITKVELPIGMLSTLFIVLASTTCFTGLSAIGCLNRTVAKSVQELTEDDDQKKRKRCGFCCKRSQASEEIEKNKVAKFEAKAKYKKELEKKYGIVDENESRRRKEQKLGEKEYEASIRILHVEILRAEQLQAKMDSLVVECLLSERHKFESKPAFVQNGVAQWRESFNLHCQVGEKLEFILRPPIEGKGKETPTVYGKIQYEIPESQCLWQGLLSITNESGVVKMGVLLVRLKGIGPQGDADKDETATSRKRAVVGLHAYAALFSLIGDKNDENADDKVKKMKKEKKSKEKKKKNDGLDSEEVEMLVKHKKTEKKNKKEKVDYEDDRESKPSLVTKPGKTLTSFAQEKPQKSEKKEKKIKKDKKDKDME